MPDRISEPDRTWLALAAYNIGYGHLEDARILAKKKKLNPDSWTDLKATLPLLAKSEYHGEIKHGYARGGETVIFVENVRTYYDILSQVREALPARILLPRQPSLSRQLPKRRRARLSSERDSLSAGRPGRSQASSFCIPPI